jgi:hypothetical protein
MQNGEVLFYGDYTTFGVQMTSRRGNADQVGLTCAHPPFAMDAFGPVGTRNAMRPVAPYEEPRRMIRKLGDRLDFFRALEQPDRTRQVLRPCNALGRMQGRNPAHRALGQGAFDRCEAEDFILAEPRAERIDQLAHIHIRAIGAHMAPHRLAFGDRLHPGPR